MHQALELELADDLRVEAVSEPAGGEQREREEQDDASTPTKHAAAPDQLLAPTSAQHVDGGNRKHDSRVDLDGAANGKERERSPWRPRSSASRARTMNSVGNMS